MLSNKTTLKSTIPNDRAVEIEGSVPENTITPKTEKNAIREDSNGEKKEHPVFCDQVTKKKIDTNDRADTRTTHDKSDDTSKEKTFDDTIAKIKTLHLEGKTNGEIVKVLNNNGYPTFKGSRGKWKTNQVKTLLKRIE